MIPRSRQASGEYLYHSRSSASASILPHQAGGSYRAWYGHLAPRLGVFKIDSAMVSATAIGLIDSSCIVSDR